MLKRLSKLRLEVWNGRAKNKKSNTMSSDNEPLMSLVINNRMLARFVTMGGWVLRGCAKTDGNYASGFSFCNYRCILVDTCLLAQPKTCSITGLRNVVQCCSVVNNAKQYCSAWIGETMLSNIVDSFCMKVSTVNVFILLSLTSQRAVWIFEGTTSPAERCDLGGVKLWKVHDFFKFVLTYAQGRN